MFERKESKRRYSEFGENPGEYDIWFIGTSHIFYSVQPMELWGEHGIRSYDLAAPNSYMLQTYWTMMCALQYGEPQIVVLDPYKVHLEEKHQDKKQTIHIGLDGIPFSKMKMDGICDIFDNWGDRFEYISKFSIYHNRWEELSKSDYEVDYWDRHHVNLFGAEKITRYIGDYLSQHYELNKGEYAFFVENDRGEVVDKAVFKKGERQ